MRDLREELKWIAEGGSQAAVPGKLPRRPPFGIAAVVGGVLTIAAIAIAVWLWRSNESQQPRQVVRFALSTADSPTVFPSISPDGRHIAYLAGKDRNLWIQDHLISKMQNPSRERGERSARSGHRTAGSSHSPAAES